MKNKKQSADFMIDVETLGKSCNSIIVQIACVCFDRTTGKIIDRFVNNITQKSCLGIGMTKDYSTVKWWKSQPKHVRDLVFTRKGYRPDITQAIYNLDYFVRQNMTDNKAVFWGHANFDYPLIDNAFKLVKVESPFKFWHIMDLRTINDLAKSNNIRKYPKRQNTYHEALTDAEYQVKMTCYYLKQLELV